MSVTLTVVQRIAADVAREQDRRLEVVGAVPAQGEIGYAEVILTIDGVNQSFSANRILFTQDLDGGIAAGSSHGFNFGSAPLTSGRHTARILWRVGGPHDTNEVCAFHRDLTILHR